MKKGALIGGLLLLIVLGVAFPFLFYTQNDETVLWQTRHLQIAANGQEPTAWDFFTEESQINGKKHGYTVEYAAEAVLPFHQLGEQVVSVVIRSAKGRESVLEIPLTVVYDTTAPTFAGVRDRSAACGTGVALRDGITVTDDCFGDVSWNVDNGNLNVDRPGYYQVIYRAQDAAGNQAETYAYVTVFETEITEEVLRAKAEPLLASLLPADGSPAEICRAVYTYVMENIAYFPLSDKTDYRRAAYDALFVTGRGDCYSYCSAARVLLAYAGIETIEVERIPGLTEDRHYWLLVNIAAAGEAPRWYHLDPTPLDPAYGEREGFLLTDAQLAAYNEKRPNFYAYEKDKYPVVQTEVWEE